MENTGFANPSKSGRNRPLVEALQGLSATKACQILNGVEAQLLLHLDQIEVDRLLGTERRVRSQHPTSQGLTV